MAFVLLFIRPGFPPLRSISYRERICLTPLSNAEGTLCTTGASNLVSVLAVPKSAMGYDSLSLREKSDRFVLCEWRQIVLLECTFGES